MSKKPITLGLSAVGAVAGLAFFSMVWGHQSAVRDLPPNQQLTAVGDWLRHNGAVRAVWHTITGQEDVTAKAGRWRRAPSDAEKPELTPEQQAEIEQLQAIGYLSGYEEASDKTGVIAWKEGEAYNGLNLYVSGHATEAVLTDMEGNELHKWSYSFEDALPNDDADSVSTEYWRRVHLYDNGDMLAIFEGIGLIRVDKDSNLLWAVGNDNHHAIHVDDEGQIWSLTRKAHILPRINETVPVLEDFVTLMTGDGKVLREVSVLEAFENSSYASLLNRMPESGDLLHTNSVELLDGSHADLSPAFSAGRLLISLPNIDTIAVMDLEGPEIVWAAAGQWTFQHDPSFLDNGNILVFDNQGHKGMSKVVEINPLTRQIEWAYEGDAVNGFHTLTCGTNTRFPNGNTLITESDSGRAFEVDKDGNMVWTFYSPARAGENGELVATLFDVQRIPRDFVRAWAPEIAGPEVEVEADEPEGAAATEGAAADSPNTAE